MEYVSVAYLSKTFGLQGAFKAVSMTDYPNLRFKKGRKFYLVDEKTGDSKEVTLASFRDNGQVYLLRFEEITSIDEAEKYLKRVVNMDKADAPMPKDSYRFADLIGCKVVDQAGAVQGTVTDVLEYAPTKSLRVHREGEKDFFVPFVDKFVLEIDIEKKQIVIEVVEGMK